MGTMFLCAAPWLCSGRTHLLVFWTFRRLPSLRADLAGHIPHTFYPGAQPVSQRTKHTQPTLGRRDSLSGDKEDHGSLHPGMEARATVGHLGSVLSLPAACPLSSFFLAPPSLGPLSGCLIGSIFKSPCSERGELPMCGTSMSLLLSPLRLQVLSAVT